jgi:hypothetical protein
MKAVESAVAVNEGILGTLYEMANGRVDDLFDKMLDMYDMSLISTADA